MGSVRNEKGGLRVETAFLVRGWEVLSGLRGDGDGDFEADEEGGLAGGKGVADGVGSDLEGRVFDFDGGPGFEVRGGFDDEGGFGGGGAAWPGDDAVLGNGVGGEGVSGFAHEVFDGVGDSVAIGVFVGCAVCCVGGGPIGVGDAGEGGVVAEVGAGEDGLGHAVGAEIEGAVVDLLVSVVRGTGGGVEEFEGAEWVSFETVDGDGCGLPEAVADGVEVEVRLALEDTAEEFHDDIAGGGVEVSEGLLDGHVDDEGDLAGLWGRGQRVGVGVVREGIAIGVWVGGIGVEGEFLEVGEGVAVAIGVLIGEAVSGEVGTDVREGGAG